MELRLSAIGRLLSVLMSALIVACVDSNSANGDGVAEANATDAERATAPITATLRTPSAVYDGYVFWHNADEIGDDVINNTYLSDAAGNIVHVWPTELTGGGTPAYLLDSGRVVRTGVRDKDYARSGPVVSSDTLQVVEQDGTIAWEVSAKDLGDFLFHHDIEPMPNGNFLVTTYHPIDADEARAMGWDPGEKDRVWSDGVVEIQPDYDTGAAAIVWRWLFADHIVQDRFPGRPNYGLVAETPHRIDPHYPASYAPSGDVRQHINSIDYNAELDQIALSVFIYNEIWIVDHSTSIAEARTSSGGRSGMGGDLLYRYGNPEAYDRGQAEDRIFLKQHDANWIDAGLSGAGDLLVHNNNTVLKPNALGLSGENGRTGAEISEKGVSEIYQLRLPVKPDGTYGRSEDGSFAAEHVWVWQSPEYFAAFQGGARRLENGSTFLTDTEGRLALEVDADGDIVAEYKGAAPSFKAFKYSEAEVSTLFKD